MYTTDEATALQAAEAAFEKIKVLNSVFSDYDSDSEVSRLSRTSGSGTKVTISSALWDVLARSQELAAKSNGAFDVTIGPLVNLWRRARRKNELPAAELREEMKARVGYRNLVLDPESRTAQLRIPEMRIDLGAIAKGYAIDEALKVLKQRGITRALIGGSGDMAAGVPPPGQPGWKIEVAALDVPGAPPPQVVYLNNSAIATSGDVFQRVEIGGKRYSHIVDPHTGLGLTDHALVTVIATDCTTADSYATAVSLLGPEQGLKLVDETKGMAAYIVRKPGEAIQAKQSAAWKDVPKANSTGH
jgi:thiamine biosynthesis lipoprotein